MKKRILFAQFIVIIGLLVYGVFNLDNVKTHIIPYCLVIIILIVNFYIIYREKPKKEGPFKDLP